MQRINITKPDDWHLHLRDGSAMRSVVGLSAAQMGRAVIMPNLSPPVRSVSQAKDYYRSILEALPPESTFKPLMVLYLTDKTTKFEIIEASKTSEVHAVKLYPAGATTNSDSGVTKLSNTYPALEQMQKAGLPLLIHGEVTDIKIDIFDREKVFIDKILTKLIKDFPDLKIVFEHITTKDAVDFVNESSAKIAATITPHHLLANRNHMLVGGVRPHFYCLPVLKRKTPHQESLVGAATSGSTKFFLGTDSAPHERNQKESACGCAGVFSANAAIELYAEAFERAGKIDRLEGFASFYGADFYGLPRNKEQITLEKKPWKVPRSFDFSGSEVIPFFAGEELMWKFSG